MPQDTAVKDKHHAGWAEADDEASAQFGVEKRVRPLTRNAKFVSLSAMKRENPGQSPRFVDPLELAALEKVREDLETFRETPAPCGHCNRRTQGGPGHARIAIFTDEGGPGHRIECFHPDCFMKAYIKRDPDLLYLRKSDPEDELLAEILDLKT
jgi:hypothetical protein